jgi:hypothetical protein
MYWQESLKFETAMKKFLPMAVTGVLALIIGLMPLVQAVPSTTTVTGEVTITAGSLCGLSATSGSPIQYGSLADGQLSQEKQLVIANTGSVPTNLFLDGSNWKGGALGDDQMAVTNTHYDKSGGVAYAAKVALTTTTQDQGVSIMPGTSEDWYFQVEAHLSNPAFTGLLKQDVNLGANC